MRNLHVREKLGTEAQVGDLIVRSNVVDLANGTLVEDCVESIRSVSGKKISSRGRSVPMEHEGLTTVKKTSKFRDDLCI